jgi:hypothetical protein
MNEFEFLAILPSIVFGLAITHLLPERGILTAFRTVFYSRYAKLERWQPDTN